MCVSEVWESTCEFGHFYVKHTPVEAGKIGKKFRNRWIAGGFLVQRCIRGRAAEMGRKISRLV